MKQFLKVILSILIIKNIVSAQFISDRPIMSLPSNVNGTLDNNNYLGLFDPSRILINHSFEMSMFSNNGNPISVTGLTNQIEYKATENFVFDANIGLYLPQSLSSQMNSLNNLNMTYDAGITYRPSNNSFLKIRIQNFPDLYKRQNRLPSYHRFIQ